MAEKKQQLIEKDLTEKGIGVCIAVSRELGGGFLESVYAKALFIAFQQAGLRVVEQVPLKVLFRGIVVGDFYPDMVVEDRLIIEIKAVKALTSEHEAQLIRTYLKIGSSPSFPFWCHSRVNGNPVFSAFSGYPLSRV